MCRASRKSRRLGRSRPIGSTTCRAVEKEEQAFLPVGENANLKTVDVELVAENAAKKILDELEGVGEPQQMTEFIPEPDATRCLQFVVGTATTKRASARTQRRQPDCSAMHLVQPRRATQPRADRCRRRHGRPSGRRPRQPARHSHDGQHAIPFSGGGTGWTNAGADARGAGRGAGYGLARGQPRHPRDSEG